MLRMIFTQQQVKDTCNTIAPIYKFDPLLIFAVCLQEGGRNKSGEFTPDMARLEQGFYLRYVEKNDLPTTTEILLSASYGVMQIMGLNLLRLKFFEFYFNQSPIGLQAVLKEPVSQFGVVSGIDAFCENLSWQIEYGCRLMTEKREKANGDTRQMLLNWNGGGNKK